MIFLNQFCLLGIMLLPMESGIGALDHQVAIEAAQTAISVPHKQKQNKKFTDKDRYIIGKYASENGTAAAQRKFKLSHKNLGESTIRTFKKKYETMIKNARINKETPQKRIVAKKRGRPVLLREIDEMVQRFLEALRKKGGVVNAVVARSVAKALVKSSGKKDLEVLDLDGRWWIQSLFRRMGFVRRAATTSKVEIPEGAKKEAEMVYLYKIVSMVEKYQIPKSMILNLDQTPLKFAPCSRHTLEKRNEKHVAISGTSYKQAITGIFVITLDGNGLPFQLIYGEKTSKSMEESLKILEEVIIPYLKKQREVEQLSEDHPALLILDLFRGQLTKVVVGEMQKHNILMCQVPANMTHIFQPLDLTVNGSAKSFLKAKFIEWFAEKIDEGLEEGKALEDIDIKLTLTLLQPIHGSWICDLYNYLSSSKGKSIIENGWNIKSNRSWFLKAPMFRPLPVN